jgi:RES domain-containing protein
VKVYRIAKREYASDLSGIGASLYPGRWNKRGYPVIYTGESTEIALLEIVVHTPPQLVPDLNLVALQIPEDSIAELDLKSLPENWSKSPPPSVLSEIGNNWLESRESVALKVPSSIVPDAFNYLLNCQHPDFNLVHILSNKPFNFDPRLTS